MAEIHLAVRAVTRFDVKTFEKIALKNHQQSIHIQFLEIDT